MRRKACEALRERNLQGRREWLCSDAGRSCDVVDIEAVLNWDATDCRLAVEMLQGSSAARAAVLGWLLIVSFVSSVSTSSVVQHNYAWYHECRIVDVKCLICRVALFFAVATRCCIVTVMEVVLIHQNVVIHCKSVTC